MITIVTADIHASPNPRDAYRWKFIEETLPALVAEHGAERVLVLGDLTEAKAGHSAELVNRLVDALAALAAHASVYLLMGNHDYLSEDVPFYRFTRHLPRVRWINDPTALTLRGLGKCLFLPHTRDLTSWVDHMHDEYDWFFCHQTFGGADLGGRRAAGDGPPFSKNSKVVSGDVHSPQRVGPVTYVGAPYSVDFGDAFEPRVLLLEGAEMRSVPVPGPQKRLVEVPSITDLTGAEKNLRPGDVVKVRATMETGEYSRAEARKNIREWAASVGVELYAVEIIAPRAAPTKMHDRHRASDEELVRGYAKKMGKGKSTVSAGLKIMDSM